MNNSILLCCTFLSTLEHLKSFQLHDYQLTKAADTASVFLSFSADALRPLLAFFETHTSFRIQERSISLMVQAAIKCSVAIWMSEGDKIRAVIDWWSSEAATAEIFWLCGSWAKNIGSKVSCYGKKTVMLNWWHFLRRYKSPPGLYTTALTGWTLQSSRLIDRDMWNQLTDALSKGSEGVCQHWISVRETAAQ